MAAEPMFEYLRIAGELRQRAAGMDVYARIPSQDALAAEFGADIKTVRHAVRVLVDEGVLTKPSSMGTFVAPMD